MIDELRAEAAQRLERDEFLTRLFPLVVDQRLKLVLSRKDAVPLQSYPGWHTFSRYVSSKIQRHHLVKRWNNGYDFTRADSLYEYIMEHDTNLTDEKIRELRRQVVVDMLAVNYNAESTSNVTEPA